jgi:SNF2 family DNA or RNA helicase
MEIIEDTVVRLNVDADTATRVVTTLDKSEIVGRTNSNTDLLVYWGYDESYFLADKLSIDIPSPIYRDYDWPGLLKPFSHQKVTASYLSIRSKAFCFNEAGTGKTSSVIWAADYLMRLGVVKRVLVVCPLSIMYSAWQADIFKTAMHRTAGVAYGSKEKRSKILNNGYEFVIINYDGINVIREEIATSQFDLIVIDEANAYKSSQTKRWKNMAKILTPDTRLWMLTGTPASQSPVDAFGLAKLVSPWRVPRFESAWKDKVMYQHSKFVWVPRPNSKIDVYNALQPAIRFTKKECLDLPPVMYQTRRVPLTPQAASYYKKLKSQMLIEMAGQQVTAVNAAANMSKLLQISGGAVYTDKHDVVEFDISPRLQAMQEVLDETQNKVIIFVPFLHTIEIITRHLNKHKISNDIINGSVSAGNRAMIINRFQTQEDPTVLVIQPQSASHGVTLTAADTIIFWSPVMSVETYIQCIGRIDRVGQVNKMTVVHLQGSDVEDRIYKMLQGKVDSHLKLVDLYKQELGV